MKGAKEPNRDSNDLKVTDMNFVDMDPEETIEHMQPDVERSDTEPDQLAKTLPGVTNEIEKSEGKQS